MPTYPTNGKVSVRIQNDTRPEPVAIRFQIHFFRVKFDYLSAKMRDFKHFLALAVYVGAYTFSIETVKVKIPLIFWTT